MMPDSSENKPSNIGIIIIAIVVIIGLFFFIFACWKHNPVERPAEKLDAGDNVQEPADQSQDNERNKAEDKYMKNDIKVGHSGTRHNNNGAPRIKGSEEEDNGKGQNEKPTYSVSQQDQIVDDKCTGTTLCTSPADNVAPFLNIETSTCDPITNPSSKSSSVDVEVSQSPIQKEMKITAVDLDDGSPTKVTTGSEVADQPEEEVILEDDIVKKDEATPLEKTSPEALALIPTELETHEYLVTAVEVEEAEVKKSLWVVPGYIQDYVKDLTSDLSEPDIVMPSTHGVVSGYIQDYVKDFTSNLSTNQSTQSVVSPPPLAVSHHGHMSLESSNSSPPLVLPPAVPPVVVVRDEAAHGASNEEGGVVSQLDLVKFEHENTL